MFARLAIFVQFEPIIRNVLRTIKHNFITISLRHIIIVSIVYYYYYYYVSILK